MGLASTQPARNKTVSRNTAYERRLAEWLRDSAILDSMTKLVPTDSLYRLYRHAVDPAGVTLAVFQEAWCEEIYLEEKFGVVPARRAERKLQDTMYRDRGISDGAQYFLARSASVGLVKAIIADFLGQRSWTQLVELR